MDEKEEFDVVSQADDASQEEDIEEESIPEERRGKYATRSRYRRRRYGVKYRPGRQHLRWKKDIELEEYGRFVLAQLMWINLRRMPSVCPMSPLTYLRVVAACVEACDDPVGYDYLQRVPCCTIDSDRCYQYCSSVP